MKLLPEEFLGTGEVKGDVFHIKHRSEHALMYERVNIETGVLLYEVFQRKFNKPSETIRQGVKVVIQEGEFYPKQDAFGRWAWCFSNYDKAIKKFNELTEHYGKEQAKKESGGQAQAIR